MATTTATSPKHQPEAAEDASIALARQLMAEEAMNSYAHHYDLLRGTNEWCLEDGDVGWFGGDDDDDEEVNYEGLLELSDRLGSVKHERYALIAAQEIAKLPIVSHDSSTKDDDGSGGCCLVCQCEYQDQEAVRVLPCQHRFHVSCVDPWLMEKDVCPSCRESILTTKEETKESM